MKLFSLCLLLLPVVLSQNCPFGFTYDTTFGSCLGGWSSGTWSAANFQCTYYGYNLLSIHNAQQNIRLAQLANQNNDHRGWLGLVNTQGQYSWTDGTPFDYQKFQSTGGGNCVYLDGGDQFWKRVDCTVTLPFLCSTPPIATTINDYTDAPTDFPTNPPSNLTCLSPSQEKPYHCQQGWQYFQGYEYLVIFDDQFNDGESECVSLGGHLASIHSKEENDFVTGLCCQTECQTTMGGHYATYLIGGQHVNGQMVWRDGTPFDYKQSGCVVNGDGRDGYDLEISNFQGCTNCGTPGEWIWESDFLQSYAVCKRKRV